MLHKSRPGHFHIGGTGDLRIPSSACTLHVPDLRRPGDVDVGVSRYCRLIASAGKDRGFGQHDAAAYVASTQPPLFIRVAGHVERRRINVCGSRHTGLGSPAAQRIVNRHILDDRTCVAAAAGSGTSGHVAEDSAVDDQLGIGTSRIRIPSEYLGKIGLRLPSGGPGHTRPYNQNVSLGKKTRITDTVVPSSPVAGDADAVDDHRPRE